MAATTQNRSTSKTASKQVPKQGAKSTLDRLADEADAKTRARYEQQAKEGVINPIVLATLLDVKPQMIYNYLRKGKLTDASDAVGENNTQKKVIRLDEANTFAQGYTERKVAREEAKAEQTKAELEAE